MSRDGWRTVTVEEVAEDVTVGHFGPMADQYLDSGVPFLRSLSVEPFTVKREGLKYISSEFHQRLRKSALKPGDVVIVRTGKPGACAVVPEWLDDANCSDLVIVRCGRQVRSRFLCYVVNSTAGHHISSHTVGAVQQHFNVGSARTLKFLLPPIPTQDGILDVLGALDDKIELNRRMNETLEAMARAIFRDWFVDFGPTRAKMAMRGEDPQKEGVARAPYLAPDLWSLFPDKLDETTGLPEGWELGTLADVAETVGSNVSPQTVSSDTPYIGLEHMPRQSLALDTWEGAGKVASGKSSFVQGDILFGKLRPYFHKVGLAPIEGICSTDIVVLNSQRPHFHAFVTVAVSSDEFVAFTDRTSDGTKMPRTSWGKMSAFPLGIPKDDTASAFEGIVSPLFGRMQQSIRESRTLAETRDYLLPKLMSGEIRMRDAERIAGEAA